MVENSVPALFSQSMIIENSEIGYFHGRKRPPGGFVTLGELRGKDVLTVAMPRSLRKGARTRMSPNRSGSSFRDGAMTALGGKISYGCPSLLLGRGDIVAQEEPQSDSWASDKDLWKS